MGGFWASRNAFLADPFGELILLRRYNCSWENHECATGCCGRPRRDHCGLGADSVGSGGGPGCGASAEASGVLLGTDFGDCYYAVGAGSFQGLMAAICRDSAGSAVGSGVGDNLWPECAGIRRGNFHLRVDLLAVSGG